MPSVVGFSYELDYKDSLNDPDWLPLTLPLPGTGDVISLEDATLPDASRFYRIRCYLRQSATAAGWLISLLVAHELQILEILGLWGAFRKSNASLNTQHQRPMTVPVVVNP